MTDTARSITRLGLLLFLLSLAVLFLASIVAYLIIFAAHRGTAPPQVLPSGLWISTLVLLSGGLVLHRAKQAAVLGLFPLAGRRLQWAFASSALFLAIQFPSLNQLLQAHRSVLEQSSFGAYGLAFGLVILHAAHVFGGMVPLGLLAWKARRGTLASPNLTLVRSTAIYWHFLEGVWLALFALFLLTL